VLLAGGLILVGAVSMTKFQRVHEAAVFRTLGASTRLMTGMIVLEYAVLGLLAGAVGSLGATALNWGLSRFVLDGLHWSPAPLTILFGVSATTAMVSVVGAASNADVLRRRPLVTLRAE
jgi:putative ABC transport system permease protein